MGAVVTVAELGAGVAVAAGDAERAAAAAAAAFRCLGAIFVGWLRVLVVCFWCRCRKGGNWVVGGSVGYEVVVVVVEVSGGGFGDGSSPVQCSMKAATKLQLTLEGCR
jgi:hypothetical protein